MAIEEFDVFIIGTGTAGKKVAYACAKAGWSVAIADNREYGGTCYLVAACGQGILEVCENILSDCNDGDPWSECEGVVNGVAPTTGAAYDIIRVAQSPESS